jgi:hypothetical protein
VKVIVDAEVGSIATKAKEIKATWVILDRYYYTLSNYSILSNNLNNNVTTLNILNFLKSRFQKKEAGQCIKQLNSNVVLIDHQIPRIIKAVTSMIGENFSKSQNQMKQQKKLFLISWMKILQHLQALLMLEVPLLELTLFHCLQQTNNIILKLIITLSIILMIFFI